jgi:hypothetical protein
LSQADYSIETVNKIFDKMTIQKWKNNLIIKYFV